MLILGDIFIKEKPHIVIHNAAQLSVRDYLGGSCYECRINVKGGLNVFNL